MSLLGLKRKSAKPGPSPQWLLRMIFILLGLAPILLGWAAIEHGYWWLRNYDPILGFIGVAPTLAFVFMGALFIFIGLIPWPRAAVKNKSKDDIYRMP